MAHASLTPKGRGFDKSLVYFEGAQDHFTQRSCCDPACLEPVNASTPCRTPGPSPYDLWVDDGTSAGAGSMGVGVPAAHLVETAFNGHLFNDFAVQAVKDHDLAEGPLFMYLAPASAHSPLQAPARFIEMYPEEWYVDRRLYAAECSVWDEILGNVTAAFKARAGMWESTLLVFSADNGGPVYWSPGGDWFGGGGANNWPLKGGKASPWEGGVRASAFVSGGFVPTARRGTKLGARVHIADWYATFCALAGFTPTDDVAAAAGLPPIDSVDLWPLLTGSNSTAPHEVMPLAVDVDVGQGTKDVYSALLMGEWKWVVGLALPQSFHQGPQFPNASIIPYGEFNNASYIQKCPDLGPLGGGCLYNLAKDPNESVDVAEANVEVVKRMRAQLDAVRGSKYQMPSDTSQQLACLRQKDEYNNFFGPWLR